jgi:uncharacterized phiE125 gp8 family phage protein
MGFGALSRGSRRTEVIRERDVEKSLITEHQFPSLEDIKDQLSIGHSQDDTHLSSLRDAIVDYFQRVTGHHIHEAEREVTFDGVKRKYRIPRTPWDTLVSVTVSDEGTDESVDTADFFVSPGPPVTVELKSDKSIPSGDRTRIKYEIGYADEESIPPGIEQALKVMITDVYENRTSVPISAQTLEAVPFDWEALTRPYTVMTL